MDAFLDNKACFLEQEQWRQVLRLATSGDESFADQKSLVLNLWAYLLHGPRMFRKTTDVIFEPSTPQCIIDDLIERLLEARNGLLQWLHEAQALVGGTTAGKPESNEDNLDSSWCQMFETGADWKHSNTTQLLLRGTFTMCHILKARLLYALAPSRFHHLEIECQKLAKDVVSSTQCRSTKGDKGLAWTSFASQSVWLAKGILATKQSWSEGWQGREGVIEKCKFEAWCKAIGRKCPLL